MAIANVPSGTENVTLTNLPAGWSIMPGNPQFASGPPDATVNFALEPSSPTCSSVRVTPNSTIYQGQTATVTATCQGAAGQQVSYYWQIPTGQLGTVDDTGTNATTYHAPANVQPNGTITDPTVVVCNPGVTPPSPLCKAYSATVTILPYFTISGNVFVDADRDKILDHGESNYTGTINVSTTAGNVSYPSAGAFTISNLPAGEYYVAVAKVSGYEFTTSPTLPVKVGPNNGQGPSGSGIILTKCDPESSTASCGANGDITGLKFGISNSYPWIQTGSAGGLPPGVGFSGDSSFAGGVENPIPSTATLCTPYSSLNGPQGTPGVINSGSIAPSFCSGGDPGCLNLSSSPQWVTGGAAYPDPFRPSNLGIIKTSFGYMSSLAQAGGVDLTSSSNDLAQYCSGGIANCTLSSSIPHEVYIAKGNLTLVGSGYTFPSGQNFVILVNGDLTIKEEIHVPTGSTVLFTTSKNIYIDSGVGESSITSTASDIEGFYSADQSFIVQKGPGVSCPASDNRLNIAGSIVVNAGLNGGTFQNQRDLCAGDIQCPSVYIGGRPDLIINSPQFIWSTKKVWQEITP
jgi:hypothetical protein